MLPRRVCFRKAGDISLQIVEMTIYIFIVLRRLGVRQAIYILKKYADGARLFLGLYYVIAVML